LWWARNLGGPIRNGNPILENVTGSSADDIPA